MCEQSTTPDLVELVRKQLEALDRHDLDGVMSSVAEDSVLDGRAAGGLFEGRAAIRGFLEDWFSSWEELDFELEEASDLGGGVVFAVVIQDGRLAGGDGRVRQREGWVYLWAAGSIARLTTFEVDQARAAAERLAEQREHAMSHENVEVVRCAVAALNARDVDGYLACCTDDVELYTPLAAFVGAYERRAGIERWLVDVQDAAPDFHIDLQDVKALGSHQVLAFAHLGSTGRASGVPLAGDSGNVYDLVDGKIRRTRIFLDRAEALKAVGLEE
jgi:ketosteroid isomerase-like protein